MKKFLLLLTFAVLAQGAFAQNETVITSRGETFKQCLEDVTYKAAKKPKYYTDKRSVISIEIEDYKRTYPLEFSYKTSDTTFSTLGIPMSFQDTTSNVVSVEVDNLRFTLCSYNGKYYLFRNKLLGSKQEMRFRKKEIKPGFSKKDKVREPYIDAILAKTPGCYCEPFEDELKSEKKWSEREVIMHGYQDLHHQMWRDYTLDDYKYEQLETDVEIFSLGKDEMPASINAAVMKYIAETLWDNPIVYTDNKSFCFVMTRYEGRGAVIAFFLDEKGTMKSLVIVPRPKASFSKFLFKSFVSGDVFQMDFTEGQTDIKVFKDIGMGLTKNPTTVQRYQLNFKGPGEDTWKDLGEVEYKQ